MFDSLVGDCSERKWVGGPVKRIFELKKGKMTSRQENESPPWDDRCQGKQTKRTTTTRIGETGSVSPKTSDCSKVFKLHQMHMSFSKGQDG